MIRWRQRKFWMFVPFAGWMKSFGIMSKGSWVGDIHLDKWMSFGDAIPFFFIFYFVLSVYLLKTFKNTPGVWTWNRSYDLVVFWRIENKIQAKWKCWTRRYTYATHTDCLQMVNRLTKSEKEIDFSSIRYDTIWTVLVQHKKVEQYNRIVVDEEDTYITQI